MLKKIFRNSVMNGARRSVLRSSLILGCGILTVVGTVEADDVIHFTNGAAPGNFPLVDTILDLTGIGSTNTEAESLARTFIVPGSGPVELTFTVEFDGGAFLYEFGMFEVSAVTADPVTEKQLFAEQALAASVSIFDDRVADPGSTVTLSVMGGQELAFFIVPNNTIANFLASPDDFYQPLVFDFDLTTFVGLRAPLFSIPDANPGNFDQLLAFISDDTTLFTFEDLTRAGASDLSFGDLAFSIDAVLVGGDDDQPPTIDYQLATDSLWPPNHKLVDIGLDVTVLDNADPLPTYEIFVYFNEPNDDQTGDGATESDYLIDDNALLLRAERKGNGAGRVYLVVIVASDIMGNQSFQCCAVTVPHSLADQDLAAVEFQAAEALLWCVVAGVPPEGWFLLESPVSS